MVGHGMIAFAQRELPMATIGVIQVGQPAIAVCWGALILGEQIELAQVPGMVLVITGLVAFTVIAQRRTPTEAATRGRRSPRGARRTGGLRGRPPPPTREPEPGNAGGGIEAP